MLKFIKLFTLCLFLASTISCGKGSGSSKKSSNKANKNNETKLLNYWERVDEQEVTYEFDFTKSILGKSSPVTYSLYYDKKIIICSGTILLKGTDTRGTVDELVLNLDVYPVGDVLEELAKVGFEKAMRDHKSNTYTLNNSELKMCDVSEKNCVVYK